jgi:uncharacterized membrane protein YcaP (DUF421 family)
MKSYKNLGSIVINPMFLQVVAFTHTIAGILFMMLFLAHVAALMLKKHRPLIPSMINGMMSKEHAKKTSSELAGRLTFICYNGKTFSRKGLTFTS